MTLKPKLFLCQEWFTKDKVSNQNELVQICEKYLSASSEKLTDICTFFREFKYEITKEEHAYEIDGLKKDCEDLSSRLEESKSKLETLYTSYQDIRNFYEVVQWSNINALYESAKVWELVQTYSTPSKALIALQDEEELAKLSRKDCMDVGGKLKDRSRELGAKEILLNKREEKLTEAKQELEDKKMEMQQRAIKKSEKWRASIDQLNSNYNTLVKNYTSLSESNQKLSECLAKEKQEKAEIKQKHVLQVKCSKHRVKKISNIVSERTAEEIKLREDNQKYIAKIDSLKAKLKDRKVDVLQARNDFNDILTTKAISMEEKVAMERKIAGYKKVGVLYLIVLLLLGIYGLVLNSEYADKLKNLNYLPFIPVGLCFLYTLVLQRKTAKIA